MVTDDNRTPDTDEQYLAFDDITRRVFMGSSAVAAGALALPGTAAGKSTSNNTSEHNDSLTTKDILQLSLDLIGADEVPADTGIYVEGTEIETALAGIDIESPEIQLANQAGYDLALAHHPVGGWPIVNIGQVVFDRGAELMVNQGVPVERAQKALKNRYRNWILNGNATDYRRNPSVAELLDQPTMNIHRPVDELSRRALVEVVNNLSSNATVAYLKTALYEALPEERVAKPDIVTALGQDTNEIGNVAVYHGAATDGGEPVARAFYENGIDTVIYIHVDFDDVVSLHDTYGDEKNLICTGHVVGDGIGFRMLCLALEAHGIDVTPISGADIAGKVSGDDVGENRGLDVGNQVPDVLWNLFGETEPDANFYDTPIDDSLIDGSLNAQFRDSSGNIVNSPPDNGILNLKIVYRAFEEPYNVEITTPNLSESKIEDIIFDSAEYDTNDLDRMDIVGMDFTDVSPGEYVFTVSVVGKNAETTVSLVIPDASAPPT